jgi:glycosyltransferase involved in cell wall biosynthesis
LYKVPKVSIIIPVYNIEQYLHQCLDSVVNQTLQEIEIIIIDDGSYDQCPAIIDKYAAIDNRVIAIHQKNRGYGAVMNRGLAIAKGEYIGIVESDDFAELNMFEKLYSIAKSHNLDIARSDYYLYNSRENKNIISNTSWIPHNLICSPRDTPVILYQTPAIWASIYRRNMIKKYNIQFLETPGSSYQDTSFAFKCYVCADRFMMVEDSFIHYRVDNEKSSVNSKSKVFCVCDEYAEIERFVLETGLMQKMKHIIPKAKFACYIWNYLRLDYKNRNIFLKRFSREMCRHILSKDIKKELYSRKDLLKIHVIVFIPALYRIMRFLHGLSN